MPARPKQFPTQQRAIYAVFYATGGRALVITVFNDKLSDCCLQAVRAAFQRYQWRMRAEQNRPLKRPDFVDAAQESLPALPDRHKHLPWPDMPERMLVVIDGWRETPRASVGWWVARALGGLFVDAEHFHVSLVQASIEARVNLRSVAAVRTWLETVSLDIGFEGDADSGLKANLAINGRWFTPRDLERTCRLVSRKPHPEFQDKVCEAVRRCNFDDRVVVAGSNINALVFPETPYKFFLDRPGEAHADNNLLMAAYYYAGDSRPFADRGLTYFHKGSTTLMVDADRCKLADMVVIVLVEAAARAFEMGYLAGPIETVIGEAMERAETIRTTIMLGAYRPDD